MIPTQAEDHGASRDTALLVCLSAIIWNDSPSPLESSSNEGPGLVVKTNEVILVPAMKQPITHREDWFPVSIRQTSP